MNCQEQTLILVKPDGVKRRLIGEIICRFERSGLQIAGLKMLTITPAQAAVHYAEHQGKPFFDGLVAFITSGPVVALVVQGPAAVAVSRKLIGATNPVEAQPGSIRGDFATAMQCNVIHGSDSAASARREIDHFFDSSELVATLQNC